MKQFFGYIRVSTAKQGQQGVSLQEQRDSILRHAGCHSLEITSWFEERETAAKRGRPVFGNMLKLLRQGKACGVVLHKIDRGARNLKDWADMADLIDAGIGLIHLTSTGETFSGAHMPLVQKSLFDRVHLILSAKSNTRAQHHDFLFRRLLHCKLCGSALVGERQKGHHYYRCHTKACPVTSIREELIEIVIQQVFASLRFNDKERAYFVAKLAEFKTEWRNCQDEHVTAMNLRLKQVGDRLNRVTDAFLDGAIERDLFEQRKRSLLMEQKQLEENMANLRAQGTSLPDRLSEFLELAGNAWLSYQMGIPDERRDLLKVVTSNRHVTGKNVVIELSFPFCEVVNRSSVSGGVPQRDIPRTWDELLPKLMKWFAENPTVRFSANSVSKPAEMKN